MQSLLVLAPAHAPLLERPLALVAQAVLQGSCEGQGEGYSELSLATFGGVAGRALLVAPSTFEARIAAATHTTLLSLDDVRRTVDCDDARCNCDCSVRGGALVGRFRTRPRGAAAGLLLCVARRMRRDAAFVAAAARRARARCAVAPRPKGVCCLDLGSSRLLSAPLGSSRLISVHLDLDAKALGCLEEVLSLCVSALADEEQPPPSPARSPPPEAVRAAFSHALEPFDSLAAMPLRPALQRSLGVAQEAHGAAFGAAIARVDPALLEQVRAAFGTV